MKMSNTKNNPQYKDNGKSVKPQETPAPAPENKVQEKKKDETTPATKETPTLKTTYRDLFAKEASRISGKEFKGDPTLEAVNGHPLLQKYYQNWLNCEAE